MHPIHTFGTQAQKDKFLPGLGRFLDFHQLIIQLELMHIVAKGELVGCFVSIEHTSLVEGSLSSVLRLISGFDRAQPRL